MCGRNGLNPRVESGVGAKDRDLKGRVRRNRIHFLGCPYRE